MTVQKLSDRTAPGIPIDYYSTKKANLIKLVNEFKPTDLPGILFWVKSDTGVVHENNRVSEWADQSSLNHTLSQVTFANKPSYIESGYSTYPVIRTEGQQYLDFATRYDNIRTIYWVTKDRSVPEANKFLLGDNSVYDFHGEGGVYFQSTYAAGPILSGKFRRNGVRIDGTATARSKDMCTLSLVTTGNVGASNFSKDRSQTDRNWHGDTLELAVYSNPHTDEQVTLMQNYLKRYGHY